MSGDISDENRSEEIWKRTRFFQFKSRRDKIGFFIGLGLIAVFFPGLALFLVGGGVLYYRAKNPRQNGGI
jgi:hypothetical protein